MFTTLDVSGVCWLRVHLCACSCRNFRAPTPLQPANLPPGAPYIDSAFTFVLMCGYIVLLIRCRLSRRRFKQSQRKVKHHNNTEAVAIHCFYTWFSFYLRCIQLVEKVWPRQ